MSRDDFRHVGAAAAGLAAAVAILAGAPGDVVLAAALAAGGWTPLRDRAGSPRGRTLETLATATTLR